MTAKRNIFITITLLILLLFGNSFALAQGEASLELRASVSEANMGDEISVDVILFNPLQQSVISVRSWLEYDSNALEGLGIVTEGSPFTLSAPGEDAFDSNEGHVKIGRSNISGGVQETEVKVATVRFRVKTPNPMTTLLRPYDYQVTELGHTSINIIDQGFPINILSQSPQDISIKLNPGGAIPSQPETPEPVVISEPATPQPIGGVSDFSLHRPQNLRVDTGSGYADLKWDSSDEAELMGYNLYYGKTSGQYTRRRTVGDLNRYHLDGLNNNEAYYFAITAYDSLNRESDYSNEVAIIINEPLSSTSPFEEMLDSMLARLPEQPQNGPLTGWLLFSAVGLGGTLVFRKKNTH